MEGHAATRWLVVLGRRYQPQLRFLWDRVTPGGTFGLEFTSLMAALAVALFVLVAYTVIVGGEPGPTPGDVTAMEVVESLRAGWLVDIAKVVTALGSLVVVLPTGADLRRRSLAARRRWAEFWVLVAGMALVDRRRPRDQGRGRPAAAAGALVDAAGSSFPSGHAAYSIFYVWLAVTIVLRLRPGMARGALVVVAGDRADGPGRPLPRLPRRPLPQRRQRRLGARRRGLLALRGGGAGHHDRAAQ